jgi:hypothetical protein
MIFLAVSKEEYKRRRAILIYAIYIGIRPAKKKGSNITEKVCKISLADTSSL